MFFKVIGGWINSYLSKEKIIVNDFVADLSDGQILAAFLQKITGEKISDFLTKSGSDVSTKHNLRILSKWIEAKLSIPEVKWSTEGVAKRDCASIISLTMRLAKVLHCPFEFPTSLSIAVIKTQKTSDGVLKSTTSIIKITIDEQNYRSSKIDYNNNGDHQIRINAPPSPLRSQELLKKSHDQLAQNKVNIHGLMNAKGSGNSLNIAYSTQKKSVENLDGFDQIFDGYVDGKQELTEVNISNYYCNVFF